MITNLQDKKILITGASQGIGEDMAKYLNSLGVSIVLVARNEAKLKQLCNTLEGNNYVYPCDLSDVDEIPGIFEFCKENNIMLDGLIHCAGIVELSPIYGIDIREAKRHMDINFFAFMQLGSCFYSRKYSNNNSSIIALSSISSLLGIRGNGQYAASKAALNNLVKTMAQEFLNRKIRVNAILPSYVDTNIVEMASQYGGMSPDDPTNAQPLGMISKREISYLAEFLLSSCSQHITGDLIPIASGNNLL